MTRLQHLYNTLKLNKSINLLHDRYYNFEKNTDKHKRNYVLKYITPWMYKQVMKRESILGSVKLISFQVLNFNPKERTEIYVKYLANNKNKSVILRVPSVMDTLQEIKQEKYKQKLLKEIRGNKYGY